MEDQRGPPTMNPAISRQFHVISRQFPVISGHLSSSPINFPSSPVISRHLLSLSRHLPSIPVNFPSTPVNSRQYLSTSCHFPWVSPTFKKLSFFISRLFPSFSVNFSVFPVNFSSFPVKFPSFPVISRHVPSIPVRMEYRNLNFLIKKGYIATSVPIRWRYVSLDVTHNDHSNGATIAIRNIWQEERYVCMGNIFQHKKYEWSVSAITERGETR